MKKRKYIIVCPSCHDLGKVNNPMPVTSNTKVICPICGGSMVVIEEESGD